MRYLGSFFVGALLLVSTPAFADVAPPPDYVEECTRALSEEDDEFCVLLSAFHDNPFGCVEGELEGLANAPADPESCNSASPTDGDCCQAWLNAGWTYRCKTNGATAFSAMWCRERQEGDSPRPVDDTVEEGGCRIGSGHPVGVSIAAPVFLLLGLGILNWRSRRRSS